MGMLGEDRYHQKDSKGTHVVFVVTAKTIGRWRFICMYYWTVFWNAMCQIILFIEMHTATFMCGTDNSFSILYGKKSRLKSNFPPYRVKSTILHSKWTHLKSCCFFLFSLRSIINLAHDFKCPFLDIELTISEPFFAYLVMDAPYSLNLFHKTYYILILPIWIGQCISSSVDIGLFFPELMV